MRALLDEDPATVAVSYQAVIDRIGQLQMPILHLEGWYDAFTRGQLLLIGRLLGLERQGKVAGPNYAIVGPWNHGDSHFLAHKPFDQRILDWYRHWLDGAPAPAWFAESRVTYCEMLQARNGDCDWRKADSWPSLVKHSSVTSQSIAPTWNASAAR